MSGGQPLLDWVGSYTGRVSRSPVVSRDSTRDPLPRRSGHRGVLSLSFPSSSDQDPYHGPSSPVHHFPGDWRARVRGRSPWSRPVCDRSNAPPSQSPQVLLVTDRYLVARVLGRPLPSPPTPWPRPSPPPNPSRSEAEPGGRSELNPSFPFGERVRRGEDRRGADAALSAGSRRGLPGSRTSGPRASVHRAGSTRAGSTREGSTRRPSPPARAAPLPRPPRPPPPAAGDRSSSQAPVPSEAARRGRRGWPRSARFRPRARPRPRRD